MGAPAGLEDETGKISVGYLAQNLNVGKLVKGSMTYFTFL